MTESVRRGPDTEEPKPQLLIKSTEPVLCGYAPRAILASQDKSRIFLGCKDGSVTVVGPVAETVVASVHRVIPPEGKNQRAVRALCQLSSNELLVGRSDGS